MATKPILPYSKVQTFEYGSNVFPNEETCIRAVVTDIVGNPGVALTVLQAADELLPLLQRYAALQGPVAPAQA